MRAAHFKGLSTPILKLLLADLLDLQDERKMALDVAVLELTAREHTIWTLEVLEAREEWIGEESGSGAGGEKKEEKVENKGEENKGEENMGEENKGEENKGNGEGKDQS